jgi:hypothetical protein
MARQPLVGQAHLILEASLSHPDTPHSVGLLWTSDQPDIDTPHSVGLLWTSDQPDADTPHSVGLLWTSDQPDADTPHSVGLLQTSDQPDAETSAWRHKHSQATDIHAPGGIQTQNPTKRAAGDPQH